MTINQTILLLKLKLNAGSNELEKISDRTDLKYLIRNNLVNYEDNMLVPIVSAKGEILCSSINAIVNLATYNTSK